MQSIPMYTKAGSRLPATHAEVGRVDLRTPAVMVSPETIGVLVLGSPARLTFFNALNWIVFK